MKLPIFIEGKEYISASRAREKTGYSSDYIGQLCRGGKIPGKLIGRTWYVDLQSLLDHKKNRLLGKPAHPSNSLRQVITPTDVCVLKMDKPLPVSEYVFSPLTKKEFHFVYISDDRPLLPTLSKVGIPSGVAVKRKLPRRKLVLESVITQYALPVALCLVVVLGFGVISSSKSQKLSSSIAPSSLASTFFASAVSDALSSLVSGFRNLRETALGVVTPRDESQKSNLKAVGNTPSATGEVAVGDTEKKQSTLVSSVQSYDLESVRTGLKSELESYIDARIKDASPVTVYNTYSPVINTGELRREILSADTRPVVTKQSDSDLSRVSSAITRIVNEGSFVDPTITGATISGPLAQFTNLSFTLATGSAATTTNLFSTTASSTNLFSTYASFGLSTTTATFTIAGAGSGLTFYDSGNHDISALSGTLRIATSTFYGDLSAVDNSIDIGSAGVRFGKIYADEVNATTLVGTLTGGNLTAETLTINSDNVSTDTEDGYVAFERGSLTPNALLQWDSANDRFVFNSDLFINSGIGNGSLLVNSSTTLQNLTFVNATGSAATTTNFYASGQTILAGAGGNVGIGTTNPLSRLNVRGGTNINLNMEASGSVFDVAATNDANSSLIPLQLRGSAIYMNPSGGNVGIGTTNPGTSLHISESTSGIHSTLLIENTADQTPRIRFRTNGTNRFDISSDSTDTANLAFRNSANTAVMYLQSGGNVGIGTTNPSNKLHVAGNVKFDGNIDMSSALASASIIAPPTSLAFRNNADSTTNLTILDGGNVGIGDSGPDYSMEVYRSSGTDTTFALSNQDIAHGFTDLFQADTFLHFNSISSSQGGAFVTGLSDAAGRQGIVLRGLIGSSDPTDSMPALEFRAGKLSGAGLGDLAVAETAFQFNDSDGGSSFLTILGSGNVGIGTTNPVQKMELSGTGNTAIRIASTDGGSSFPIVQLYQEGGSLWNIENGRDGDGALGFYSGGQKYKFGTTQMTLDGPDIRVQSSYADLPLISVSDTTNNQTWNIENGREGVGTIGFYNGGTKFVIKSDGNVGIGTTNPGTILDVRGDISDGSATGSFYINNVAGNASTPTYTFQGQTNLGIFRPASDSLGFSTNGGERVRIDSNGSVGIGTTSPAEKLDIYDGRIYFSNAGVAHGITTQAPTNVSAIFGYYLGATGGAYTMGLSEGDNTAYRVQAMVGSSGINAAIKFDAYEKSGTNVFSVDSTANMFEITNAGSSVFNILGNGSIGIGTTTPQWLLNPYSATAPQLVLSAGAGVAQWAFRNAGGNLYFATTTVAGTATTSIPALSIMSSSGKVGIGVSSPDARLHLNYDSTLDVGQFINNTYNGNGTAMSFRVVDTQVGSISVTPSATAFNTSSDVRLKENISDTTLGLDKLSQIRVRDYNFIRTPDNRTQGFIAQELYEIYPDAVTVGGDDPNDKPWAVDYSKLVPLIIRSVQEVVGVTGLFKDNLTAWLADTANGITEIIAGTFRAKDQLCINDTCVTEAQLQALLIQAGGTVTTTPPPPSNPDPSTGDSGTDVVEEGSGTTSDETPSTPDESTDTGGTEAEGTTDESGPADETTTTQ